MTDSKKIIRIKGVPSKKQQLFFDSHARYIAYGGARGGGKSWALRRKLIGLCLCYPGIKCLLIRRSYSEVKSNHLRPMLDEYGSLLSYSDTEKLISLPNGSRIQLGYCANGGDTLRYQGQEYDIIAIDEATQLSEYQFSIFKACLRAGGFQSHLRRAFRGIPFGKPLCKRGDLLSRILTYTRRKRGAFRYLLREILRQHVGYTFGDPLCVGKS